jgi:hypothetical protein
MRLINTRTGLLEDFIGDNIPEYAILSHTWEEDEISLQEFQHLTNPEFANGSKTSVRTAKAGFIKIRSCVELAASKEIPYVWVDTCCIDKTSSADLTESINSMYRWYANSKICFAYLVDVESNDWKNGHAPWMESRWFTRGWTLQELIAPPEVEFYVKSWNLIGTKKRWSIYLPDITGIQKKVLETNDLSSASVAQKMSWAAHRRTTRKEDMAYCLLGLFDINMPLLYGEGEKAFLRLQEHIAASSTDHSLFAWGVPGGSADETGNNTRSYRSIFARSPAEFSGCGELAEETIVSPDSWTQTNRGFHAVFPTIPFAVAKNLLERSKGFPDYIDDQDYLAVLNCQSNARKENNWEYLVVGIWISLIDARDDGKHGFCRVTDVTALRLKKDVLRLLDSSPDKFRKDLWFAPSQRMQVPRDYFSKRLGGFLIPTGIGWEYGTFQIHSLYGSHVSGKMDVVSCPLLPLTTSGGLVGMLTVNYAVEVGDVNYENHAAIIFGYPPSLSKPVAKAVGDWNVEGNKEAPLKYALRKFIELDDDAEDTDDEDSDGALAYKCELFAISLSLGTVLHEGMIFTQLDIELHTWY